MSKLYLLDANTLIRANEDYYPFDRVRPFWTWLLKEAQEGHAKVPIQIYQEITPADKPFREWLSRKDVKDALIHNEEIDGNLLEEVIDGAYAPDLNAAAREIIGNDPFLIAYALMGSNRVVVTKEVSKPSAKPEKRKLPDACRNMGVACIDDFQFYRERRFEIK